MANLLGPLTLPYIDSAARLSDNALVLGGYFSSRAALDGLRELFRRAPDNTSVKTVVGGREQGYDLTDDHGLTAYCLFDSDRIPDGWYLLRALRYVPDEYAGHYPFSAELFFLGTDGFWQRGYDVEDLTEESNDWSL